MAISRNIKAYFKFDESSGNASDASGNGNTLTNTNTVSYSAGKVSNSADFGSSWAHTKSLSVSGTGMFGLSAGTGNEYTVAFWFKPNATPVNDGSVGRVIDIGGTGYITIQYRHTGSQIQMDAATGGGTGITYVNTFTNGTWYHIVLTCGRDNVTRLYVNGVQVGSNGTNGGSASGSNAAIGNANNNIGSNANGCACSIDELLISQNQLTEQEIADLYNAGLGVAYPLDLQNGLVSYFRMNDAQDAHGSNHLTNNNTVTFSTGKVGDCASFNGSNQYLRKAPTVTGLPNTIFSFGGWFKANNTTSAVLASFGKDGANKGAALTWDSSGRVGTEFQIGSGTGKVTSSAIGSGVWFHAMFVCDGTTVTLYVNGVSVGTAARGSGQADSTGGLIIGAWVDSSGGVNGNYFNGYADEIGLWNRALGATEVASLYASGNGIMYPLDSGIKHLARVSYHFDESSGNASDATGRGYTLTNNNTVGYAGAKFNNGLDYGTSNSNKYMARSDVMQMSNSSDWSFSCWVNPRATVSGQGQIFLLAFSGGRFFGSYMDSGKHRMYVDAGSPYVSDHSMTWTVGSWYHVACTYSAAENTYRAYINGAFATSFSPGSINYFGGGNLFRTGTDQSGTGSQMSAYQDELTVWERVLGKEEIAAIYAAGAGLQYPYSLTAGNSVYKFSHFFGLLNTA